MSLLLDALKKAAEEKKRQGDLPPAASLSTSGKVPASGNGGEEGTQLLTLLQGRPGPQDEESLQDLANTGSQAAQGGFSLSLIDEDDESLDQLGFKEQPSAPATVSFELLDDAELNDDSAVADNTASVPVSEVAPTHALSGLTLLDEDEPEDESAAHTASLPPEPATPMADIDAADNHTPVQSDASVPPTEETSLSPSSATDEQSADESSAPVLDRESAAPAHEEAVVAPDAMQTAPPSPMEQSAPHVRTSADAMPDPSTVEPVEPVGAVPEQPVTEQPVTTAGAMPPSQMALGSTADGVMDALRRRRRRRRILVLLLILMLGILAGGWGYVMYENQLQENQQLLARYDTQRLRAQAQQRAREAAAQPDAAANQTTSAVAQSLPPAQQTTPVEQPATTAQQDAGAAVAIGAQTQTSIQPAATVAPAEPSAIASTPESQGVAALVTEVTAAQNALQAERAEQVIDGAAQWPLLDVVPTAIEADDQADVIAADSGITIKRRSATDATRAAEISVRSTDNLVQQGYQAFKQGDYGRAQTLYNQALQQDAFNRDVALGLAALATRARDYEQAAAYYRQLLNYDPVDRTAFEGLIGLPDNGLDPVELESRTRNFLVRYPDSARAQAKLGSVLAQQQRWHEAQQAFFNAWQLEQSNASYALNVAVALDHLRKYRTAASYYERVLTLAALPGQTVMINLPQVRHRLAVLSRLEN